MATAIATHCLDISEPRTSRGLEPGYRLYTARWGPARPPRPPPTHPRARPGPATRARPGPDRHPPADPGAPTAPRHPGPTAGEWEIPRLLLNYDRATLARRQLRGRVLVGFGPVRGRRHRDQGAFVAKVVGVRLTFLRTPGEGVGVPGLGEWNQGDKRPMAASRRARIGVAVVAILPAWIGPHCRTRGPAGNRVPSR
ncbi:hypothetical protein GCM10010300_71980 [Streptomyces olivaceoviridis]|nr:hypothetical protein GCM10010300_71980 [Streptomyces olivaceoviridis]